MRRRSRTRQAASVGAAALLLGLAGGSGTRSYAPAELVLSSDLLVRLQTLADGLHNEIVLCLEGHVEGAIAHAVDFSMPTPRESTPMRSSFDPCDEDTLASWHNHPLPASRSAPLAETARDADPARRLCVLSGTDISTAERLRYPFVVVAVDGRTWCWWTLAEVEAFAAESLPLGRPAPGRLAVGSGPSSWARPAEGTVSDR